MSVTFETETEHTEAFECYTLVDITNTGVNDPSKHKEYQQYQNLNTMIQCLGMRSQPLALMVESLGSQKLSEYGFGTKYNKGRANVWKLSWKSDRQGYFSEHALSQDASGLPIHAGLDETVDMPTQVFETQDKALANTYFRSVL